MGSPCRVFLLNYDVFRVFALGEIVVELQRVVLEFVLFAEILHFAEGRRIDQPKIYVSLDNRHQRQRVRFAEVHNGDVGVLLGRIPIDLISKVPQDFCAACFGGNVHRCEQK